MTNINTPSPGLLLDDQAPKPWARFWAPSKIRGSGFQNARNEGRPLLETPIPDMPTGCHLSQLDRTVQICFGPWRFPLLNPGQLVGPDNPMTVDLFLWMDLGRRWKNFARSLDLLLQNGILSCYAQVLPVQTADLGTPNPETRNIANIRLHGG
jgi:hypothetical protein